MGKRAVKIAKTPDVKKANSNSLVRRTKRLQSMDTPANHILFLQRTAGNQAVSRLMRSGALQAKLKIGQPGDKYEQEADRVADQVMAMPDPRLQRQPENEEEEEMVQTKPLSNQITPLVQRQECEEEMVQTKSLANKPAPVTAGLQSRIQSLKGGGQALSGSERAFFEPRFGMDFSGVRIHNDPTVAKVARSINAKAFTQGRDVVFGNGEYAPGTISGRRLLAHELTHVVQQTGSSANWLQRGKKIGLTKPTKPPVTLTASSAYWLSNKNKLGMEACKAYLNDLKLPVNNPRILNTSSWFTRRNILIGPISAHILTYSAYVGWSPNW